MIGRVWAVAAKEFIQIRRDWRTLAVVLILPVLMLILYGYAINFDLRHVTMGVRDMDNTAASRRVIEAFGRSTLFDVRLRFDHPDEETRALDRGLARIVLVIPRGFSHDLAEGRSASLQLLVDGADSTTATTAIGYARATVAEISQEVTIDAVRRKGVIDTDNFRPVDLRTRFWYNPEQRSTVYIVPGLLVVIMMMMSSLLTAMTVVRERERGTIEQLIVSPVHPLELMAGKLVPYVVIAFVDVLLVTVAGRLIFDVPLRGSPLLLMGTAAIFLTAALGIGLFISVSSPSQQTAMTLAMLVSQLPTILLSGFIFPISAMPRPVQVLTNLIPARHFLVIVRAIFLKGVGLWAFQRQVLLLAGFGVLFLVLCSLRFKKRL
jgi:ABC-2 type transport system permease protein